jgi:hypothetical protein
MPASFFADKSVVPTESDLKTVLGKSYKHWEEIKTSLEKEFGELTVEWKHYGQKSGWILKLFYKKRNLFFLNPQKGFFAMAFVFGDKAVTQIEKSDLPAAMIDELINAKKYAEGRGIRLEVRNSETVKHILKLVNVKIQN